MRPGLRIAAVLLYLGVPLVAAATTALNLVRAGEVRATAAQREAELGPLEARLARAGPPPADDTAAVWLPGETPALASAELQQRLVELLGSVSARLIEVQGITDEEGADILMRMTYDARNEALVGSLLGVEGGLPLIDVTALEVSAEAGGEATGDPTLRVDLTVRGYRRSGL